MTEERKPTRWDPQPTELVYAPRRYPSHQFQGTGTIWHLWLGRALLGRVSFTGEPATAVLWQPAPDLQGQPAAYEVTTTITNLFHNGGKFGTPLPDVLAQVRRLADRCDQRTDVPLGTLLTGDGRWPTQGGHLPLDD